MRLTLRLIDTLLLVAILCTLVVLLNHVPTDSRQPFFRQVSSMPVRIVNHELDVNVTNEPDVNVANTTLDVDAGSDSLSNPVQVQIVR
jgi:hypothetical protein